MTFSLSLMMIRSHLKGHSVTAGETVLKLTILAKLHFSPGKTKAAADEVPHHCVSDQVTVINTQRKR